MATDDDDKRIKDVIGETSVEDLARWFGLPSFSQVAEKAGRPVEEVLEEDPGVKAVREQRAKAIASVDPGLLAAIHARHERAWGLLRFEAIIDIKVKPEMGAFDRRMLASIRTIAEAREYTRAEDLDEELKERTPQALLRDLHRPELYFDKLYEVTVTASAQERLDITAEVDKAMKADWSLPDIGPSMGRQLPEIIKETRFAHEAPWGTLPERVKLIHRRVAD